MAYIRINVFKYEAAKLPPRCENTRLNLGTEQLRNVESSVTLADLKGRGMRGGSVPLPPLP